MKVLCTMTHEIPHGGGMFTVFETGREYEVENPHEKFFTPITAPEEKKETRKARESTVTEAEINIKEESENGSN